MKQLLDVDRAFFLWLNSLGSLDYDWFWMMMTHRASNIVVYLILLGFIGYKNSWKMAGYLLEWTGNVRELRNVIERLMILGDNPVSEDNIIQFASK